MSPDDGCACPTPSSGAPPYRRRARLLDLVIGAPYESSAAHEAGAVYLVLGPATGQISLVDATARLTGEADSDNAGISVAGVGDLNADGYADVLIGAYREGIGRTGGGAAYLVLGPVSGDVSLADAAAKLDSEGLDDQAGYSVASAGDVDGDGLDDLLVGAYRADGPGADAGAAYVLYAPVSGSVPLGAADARLGGANPNDAAGFSVSSAGDVDGDGHGDLVVGAYNEATAGYDAGAAYLLLGPVSGQRSLDTAEATWLGEAGSDYAGRSVSAAGDVDADGFGDALIGSSGDATNGPNAGAAYLAFGPVSGVSSLASADLKLLGESEDGFAGTSVSGAGDVDDDGFDDLLVGAFGDGSAGELTGAAYLVLGEADEDHY